MEMRMSQSERMEQRQAMTQQMRFTQRMTLTQSMHMVVKSIWQTVVPHTELLDSVLAVLFRQMNQEDPRLKVAAEQALTNEAIHERLVPDAFRIAVPKKTRVYDFVLDCLFDKHKGAFEITDPSGQLPPQRISTTKADLHAALKNPEQLRKEIDSVVELLRVSGQQDTTGAIQHINEMKAALELSENFGSVFQQYQVLVHLALLYREQGHQTKHEWPVLGRFIRDAAILNPMSFLVCERTLSKFAFCMLQQNANPTECERRVLEGVGEFVLISMGIITPNIFAPKAEQRHSASIASLATVCRKLRDMGVDFQELFLDLRARQAGTIWKLHWDTVGAVPKSSADIKIDAFLGRTIFKHRDEILASLNSGGIWEAVSNIVSSHPNRGGAERAAAEVELRTVLAHRFESPEFRRTITALIRDHWYNDLESLLF